MKKILAVFLAVGMMTASVTGCAGQIISESGNSVSTDSDLSDSSDDSSKYIKRADLEERRIGISCSTLQGTFMRGFRIVLLNRLKKLGFKEANISFYENNGDTDLELKMIDLLIDSGIEQLVVCPNENSEISVITDKAVAAGLPLIYFNFIPSEEERARWTENKWNVTCIGADPVQVGELQGELTVSLGLTQLDMNKNGYVDYVMIGGEEESSLSKIYNQSYIKKLEEKGLPVRCLDDRYAGWDGDEAHDIMSKVLSEKGSEIELVVCQNEEMTLGAMLAIQEAERIVSSDIYLIGADCGKESLENIQRATMTGSVFNDGTAQAGAVILNMMNNIDALKNETVTTMEYVLVTAANAESIKGIVDHPA